MLYTVVVHCSIKVIADFGTLPYDWKGYEGKWLWPNLRYCIAICPEQLMKTNQDS
jgi:hypothetical protein